MTWYMTHKTEDITGYMHHTHAAVVFLFDVTMWLQVPHRVFRIESYAVSCAACAQMLLNGLTQP